MHDYVIPEPKDDYEMWESCLAAQDEQENQFRLFLITIKKLLTQVTSKKKLDPPIENKTGHFLDTTLPNLCKRLVNQAAWQTNQQIVCQILEQSYITIQIAINLLEPKQVIPLLLLLNPNVPFFIETKTGFKANKSKKYKEVVDTFIRKNGIDSVSHFINLNPTICPIDVYCGYFTLVILFRDIVDMNDPTRVVKPIEYFLENLKFFTQQSRSSNRDTFSYVINTVLKISLSNQAFCNKYVDQLITIATEHINSDNLEKNMIGISILTEIIESVRSSSFLFDPNLVLQKILDKDLHQQVIPKLTPLFVELAKAQKLTIDLLMILWEKTKTAHFSVQNLYSDLLGESLGTVSSQTFTDWQFQIVHNPNVNKIIFKVLLKCACTATDENVVRLALQTVFKYVDNKELVSAIIKDYDELKNKKIQKLSFFFIMEAIRDNSNNVELFRLLSINLKRFKENSYTLDIMEIAKYIKDNPDDENLYFVFKTAIEIKKIKIPAQAISFLFNKPTEILWKTVNYLLSQSGLNAFEVESYPEIESNLNKLPELPRTVEFMQFLKNYIILLGVEKRTIDCSKQPGSIPKKFKLNQIDTPGFSFLWRAFYEEKTSSTLVQSTIISLIEVVDILAAPSVLHFIMGMIQTSIGIKRERYLCLLYKFIQNYEKGTILSNYGYIRHKDLVIPSSRRSCLYIMNQNISYPIIFSTENKPSIEYILMKFTSYYGIGTKKAEFYYNQQKLAVSKSLSEYYIPNNAILVSNNLDLTYTRPDAYLPSAVLFQERNYNIFYDILRKEHSQKECEIIKGILQDIPSDPNLVEKIYSDISSVVSTLASEHNPVIANYILECLILPSYHANIMHEFIKFNGISEVFNKLQYKEFIDLASPWFIILSNLPPEIIGPFAIQILNFICGNLTKFQIEAKNESITFLMKLNPEIAKEIIMKNQDLIVEIISNLTNNPLTYFTKYLLSLNIPDFFVSICVPQLKNNKDPSHFIQLFVESVANATSNDIHHMLDLCFSLVDKYATSDQISNTISKLFLKAMKNPENVTFLLPKIFDTVKKAKSQKTREVLLSALTNVDIPPIESFTKPIRQFISEFTNRYFDRYSFSPNSEIRSQFGAGLRNLGATCYANSTLQQLFHLSPFLTMLFQENLTNDALISLKYLFHAMLISQRQYCDPEPFMTKLKAPGGGKINFSEEQDASEFVSNLISQFPKPLSTLFTGRNRNVFENKDENQRIENLEDFTTLPLSVQSSDSVQDSLKQTTMPEYMMYNCENIGKSIQMERTTWIDEAPPVLIISLKRFEFDLSNFTKIKINKHVEIPETLSIKDVMYNNENLDDNDYIYNLFGMVLHTGNVNSGHYFSIIKTEKDDEEQWVKYNDTEVDKIKTEKAFNDASGQKSKSQQENNTSAYLLFYIKQKSDFKFVDVNENKEICDPEIVSRIEDDNKIFIFNQCAFTPSLFELVTKFGDFELFTKYFLRIFMHSTMENDINKAENRMICKIDEHPDEICRLILDDKENVNKILTVCTNSKFTTSITKILKKVLEKSSKEMSYQMISNIINCLVSCTNMWHCIPNLSDLIQYYIYLDKENVTKIAENESQVHSILFVINDIFSDSKSQIFLQNVDASKLFDIVRNLANVKFYEEMAKLKFLQAKVCVSKVHFNNYTNMLKTISENDTLTNIFDNLAVLKTDDEIDIFLDNHPNVSTVFDQIIKILRQNDINAKNYILSHLKPFMKYLISINPNFQKSAFNLLQSLFPNFILDFNGIQPQNEGSEEANQVIECLLSLSKLNIIEKVTYENFCLAFSFIFYNSGNISQCLSDLVYLGLNVSDKTAVKTASFKLLTSIDILAKTKIETSYMTTFLKDTEMMNDHKDTSLVFLGICAIIFLTNIEESEAIKLLQTKLVCDHLINSSKMMSDYKYIEQLLDFLLYLKGKNIMVDTLIIDVYFCKKTAPVVHHFVETYKYLEMMTKMIGKLECLRNIKFTFIYLLNPQNNIVDDQPIHYILNLFDDETPTNIFSDEQWRSLIDYFEKKKNDLRLKFCQILTKMCQKDLKSNFSQIIKSLASILRDEPLMISIALLENDMPTIRDVVKSSNTNRDIIFTLLKDSDEAKKELIRCLQAAKHELQIENDFWEDVIRMASKDDAISVCKEISSLMNFGVESADMWETLLYIKRLKEMTGEDMMQLFKSAGNELFKEKNPLVEKLFL